MQGYKTIYTEAMAELVEKKSRFIGFVAPVTCEEQALAIISQRRALHREATHNVFAYILRSGQVRCSDDGEPQGTAGVPVLEVLQKNAVTDICAVVTRYFGGTMLGAGGLVRAYSSGASSALKTAKLCFMNPCTVLHLRLDYSLYGKVSYLLPSYGVVTIESDFGTVVSLKIMLKTGSVAAFCSELNELTAAGVSVETLEEKFADLP